MWVALYGDGSREARQRKGSIDLRERGDEGVLDVSAKGEEAGNAEDDEDGSGDSDEL